MMRVALIIPALNEAGNLARLVSEIPRDAAESIAIMVVDNGSTDDTATVARSAEATVVSEPRRGCACAAGIASLPEVDAVVYLDGDGSFDPAELPSLLAPIAAGQADLVVGSRVKGGISWLDSRCGK